MDAEARKRGVRVGQRWKSVKGGYLVEVWKRARNGWQVVRLGSRHRTHSLSEVVLRTQYRLIGDANSSPWGVDERLREATQLVVNEADAPINDEGLSVAIPKFVIRELRAALAAPAPPERKDA